MKRGGGGEEERADTSQKKKEASSLSLITLSIYRIITLEPSGIGRVGLEGEKQEKEKEEKGFRMEPGEIRYTLDIARPAKAGAKESRCTWSDFFSSPTQIRASTAPPSTHISP